MRAVSGQRSIRPRRHRKPSAISLEGAFRFIRKRRRALTERVHQRRIGPHICPGLNQNGPHLGIAELRSPFVGFIPWHLRCIFPQPTASRSVQLNKAQPPLSKRRKWAGKGTSPFSPARLWGAHPRGKGHSRFAVRPRRSLDRLRVRKNCTLRRRRPQLPDWVLRRHRVATQCFQELFNLFLFLAGEGCELRCLPCRSSDRQPAAVVAWHPSRRQQGPTPDLPR